MLGLHERLYWAVCASGKGAIKVVRELVHIRAPAEAATGLLGHVLFRTRTYLQFSIFQYDLPDSWAVKLQPDVHRSCQITAAPLKRGRPSRRAPRATADITWRPDSDK